MTVGVVLENSVFNWASIAVSYYVHSNTEPRAARESQKNAGYQMNFYPFESHAAECSK